MAANGMASEGTRTSAAIVLTLFSRNITISAKLQPEQKGRPLIKFELNFDQNSNEVYSYGCNWQ